MKRKLWIPIVILVIGTVFFAGCNDETAEKKQEEEKSEHSFSAKIIEINDSTVVVQPIESMITLNQDISFDISELNEIEATVGSIVKVNYIGEEIESYPEKIEAVYWENSRLEEKDEWLDKSTAEKHDYDMSDDFVITEIFSDCFFAAPVIPLPYEIKINGKLSDDWCVGDRIFCTYENYYYDYEKIVRNAIC